MDFSGQPKHLWWLLGSALLMVIGGFGPWATFGPVSIAGTEGDGWFLIVGGIAVGGLAIRHAVGDNGSATMILAGLAGAFCVLVSIIDLSDVSSTTDESEPFGDLVDPGWALWLSLIASISAGAAAIAVLFQRPWVGAADEPASAVAEPGAATGAPPPSLASPPTPPDA